MGGEADELISSRHDADGRAGARRAADGLINAGGIADDGCPPLGVVEGSGCEADQKLSPLDRGGRRRRAGWVRVSTPLIQPWVICCQRRDARARA